MKLSTPVEVKVLRRRENGSGVVEIPLLPATEIDMSQTSGGGKGKVEITVADLQEIVANFPMFPGPVPIGISPHHSGDSSGVAIGFVNAVEVRGDVLFGELDLVPELFDRVEAGGWRGFSVEMARNLKTATVELQGWALTGGVFTNRPATDVNFRIAAGQIESTEQIVATQISDHLASHFVRLKATEESGMESNEKVASLEAELKTANAELTTQKQIVETLRGQADKTDGESSALEVKLTESNKDLAASNIALAESKAKLAGLDGDVEHLRKQLGKEQQARRESEIKLEAEQARSLKESVLELVKNAIDRGVSAVHFEEVEADPVAWFSKRYVSLEAMQQFVESLPTVKESAVKSGAKSSDGKATLSQEHAARLQRLGLNTKYAGISNVDELRAVTAEEKPGK